MILKARRVRVWALVDPKGRVVEVDRSAALVRTWLYQHHPSDWRSAYRAGWRVRRLAPEEVEP